jgi:hypothetical protein
MLEDVKSTSPPSAHRPEPKIPETGFLFPELLALAPAPPEPIPPTPARNPDSAASAPWEAAAQTPAPAETSGSFPAGDTAVWKDALRQDFERWLASLDEIPQLAEAERETNASLDLYSFYEQLTIATAETRKANRRTAEAISLWGQTLAQFDSTLGPLRESVARLAAVQPKADKMSGAHCLVLIELLDRLYRISKAFEAPASKRSWWGGVDGAWRKAWATQHQALAILLSHLEEFLSQEGVTRFETLGQRFDPARMTAVAAEPDATRPPQTVFEELAPGYLRQGELLRPAQVKVTRAV